MERRLGKGLGSLLGGPVELRGTESELALASIEPNPFQPRKRIDPEALAELSESIRAHGILQPVVVRPHGARYQLIAGERRWRAARMAGLQAIPATVREAVTDQEMLELALVENVQRAELNPIERALGYRQLMESLAVTQEAVAAKVGLKRATVTNHLRLLELPSKAQEAVAEGLIDMGHARALLGLGSQGEIMRLLQDTVRQELSVREVERRVRNASQTVKATPKLPQAQVPQVPWARALEARLRARLGTEVRLEGAAAGRGHIAISFHSREELDRLCEKIAPKELL